MNTQKTEDNVLPFARPQPGNLPPIGKDWLKEMPIGVRFLCKQKGRSGWTFDSYGVAGCLPEAVLLAAEPTAGPHLEFSWVDTKVFSEQHILVAIQPEPTTTADTEAVEKENEPNGSDSP